MGGSVHLKNGDIFSYVSDTNWQLLIKWNKNVLRNFLWKFFLYYFIFRNTKIQDDDNKAPIVKTSIADKKSVVKMDPVKDFGSFSSLMAPALLSGKKSSQDYNSESNKNSIVGKASIFSPSIFKKTINIFWK